MRVAIVGYGFVGKALHGLFSEAVIYDPFVAEHANNKGYAASADVAFVCVPTEMREDGSCDTSIVEDTVAWLSASLIIIRSTVVPGTTERLQAQYPHKRIVFQPEYIGETVAHPMNNESERTFLIFGGSAENTSRAVEVFQTKYNASVKIVCCTSREAELMKYMANSSIGVMVTFMNEFYSICKAFGANYHSVREGFLMDPRMSRYFSFVYPEGRGFGGKCIPKDSNAIVQASRAVGYDPQFIADTLASNERIRSLSVPKT